MRIFHRIRNSLGGRRLWTAAGVVLAIMTWMAGLPYRAAYATHSPTNGAPPWTISRYMSTVNTTTLYDLGCKLGTHDNGTAGTQDNVVILMFGRPAYQNSTYGSLLYNNTFASVTQIEAAAEQFGRGYWVCTGGDTASTVRVVVGTSNYGTQVSAGHATAWAQMVNNVGTWLSSNGYSSQSSVAGGNDMETGWNTPSVTRAWLDAYDSVNTYSLYNFGDAGGCPQSGTTSTPGACNNGWNQEDIWYISWGSSPAWPIPQIYRTDGAMANQWQQVSLYAYLAHGSRMTILGSLTQYNSCLERGPCPTTDNRPEVGWKQLSDKLNSDSRTAQSLRWSTDISYNNNSSVNP